MFRKFLYHYHIKDLRLLSGEIEMDETLFGCRRSGKLGWGDTSKKTSSLVSIRETVKVCTDNRFAYAFLSVCGNRLVV
jgi:hypothetical protein